jgi:hypothetical protein
MSLIVQFVGTLPIDRWPPPQSLPRRRDHARQCECAKEHEHEPQLQSEEIPPPVRFEPLSKWENAEGDCPKEHREPESVRRGSEVIHTAQSTVWSTPSNAVAFRERSCPRRVREQVREAQEKSDESEPNKLWKELAHSFWLMAI